jgi:hypothetical protein
MGIDYFIYVKSQGRIIFRNIKNMPGTHGRLSLSRYLSLIKTGRVIIEKSILLIITRAVLQAAKTS